VVAAVEDVVAYCSSSLSHCVIGAAEMTPLATRPHDSLTTTSCELLAKVRKVSGVSDEQSPRVLQQGDGWSPLRTERLTAVTA